MLSRVVLMLCRVVSCCTRVMLRCLSCCYSCSFLDLIYNLIVHNPFINYLKLIIDYIHNLLSDLMGVGEGKAKMSCYRTLGLGLGGGYKVFWTSNLFFIKEN